MEDKSDRRKNGKELEAERRKGTDRREKIPDILKENIPLNRKSDWDAIDDELKK